MSVISTKHIAHHIKDLASCTDYRWRKGVREGVRSGPLSEERYQLLAARSVTSGSSTQGLPQGGVDDVDAALHVVKLLRAATRFAEKSRGVALVYEDEGVVLLSQPLDIRQRANVPVHGEDAVRDNETTPAVLGLGQHPLQVSHVLVFVAVLLRLTQTDSINDGGVIEFI